MGASATLLYDGHCRLCRAGAARLLRWARPGSVELADFQAAGVLERFPGLSHAACMQAVHLVRPDGRALRGAEAVAGVLLTRPALCAWAWLYYLPGLRTLVDAGYGWVARNRYRWFGRPACDDQGCALHFRPR